MTAIGYFNPETETNVQGKLDIQGTVVTFTWHDGYESAGVLMHHLTDEPWIDWSGDIRFASGEEVSMEDIISSYL